ncbi:unnamed protein product [Darwinula stevensoni]|uniref:C-type lectin domain-containing protein n=1 Tax=Darwinula stevensoni TaxID=69355 RepID=A0A7R9FN21_9CRUS|nr:unnamed protein product [Darwinula stevensoni]CAG0896291.1 unnamed protein product [Darwinula stevensoni]
MVALESTPIHGRDIGGNLEEMVLVLWNERESLRDDYKKLKNDFENMRKEHEDLKSSFLEHLRERDKLQLLLNTTEGRLQYLEAISLQIMSTIVLHDSMGNTAIDRCADPGCYNHSLRYDSSMKQMVALIQQSQSCEQHIRGQKANYTLGGLTCKGKIPTPDNPAQSCSTLRQAGNAHPGYYLTASKRPFLELTMCRMDLEETDPKFQVETSVHIAGEGGVSLIDVQSPTFHLVKQDAKLWPLAGSGKDVVKARDAVHCGSNCHSLRPICNAFNWYPINLTCEFVKTPNATLQYAPGAKVYVSASSGCLTPPPLMENRTMNFSYGWYGNLPAPFLSEVSYDCPRHSRCPPSLPLKAKCLGFNEWEILNLNVTPPCPGSVLLAQGYQLFLGDGRFYKRYPGPMNRTEASQVCCLDGARLASDTNQTLYSAIRMVAQNRTEAILQGATDELVEGTWVYEDPSFLQVNNTPMTSWNYWGKNSSLPVGQQKAPNGGRNKNCLSLLVEHWFDIPCSTRLPFVCQYY